MGRKPSISVSAAAVSIARAWAATPSPPDAVAITGDVRGSTSTSSEADPSDDVLDEAERVAQHERRRLEHAAARGARRWRPRGT
jgi:hypothetical protein